VAGFGIADAESLTLSLIAPREAAIETAFHDRAIVAFQEADLVSNLMSIQGGLYED
jgi:hypothetical protein